MQYRTLGRTAIKVSTVGVGFWAVSDPDKWGPQNEQDAIDAVHRALDLGVNFFDTAEGYGNGYSEELLGRALGDRRAEAVIASKVASRNLTPEAVIAACEDSLRRLGTDVIDIYQIHWPSRTVPLADTFGALERLREQGKIRVIGVSNFGPADLDELLALGRVESNQVAYSALFRAVEYGVLPRCEDQQIGVLAYSPLLHGLLTGKFATLDDVPPGRARTRHYAPVRPQARHDEPGAEVELAAALEALRAVAAERDLTLAQLALSWVIHQPALTAVIAGARNPVQVDQNALVADIMLDGETLVAVEQATAALKAKLGPNIDMWQGGAAARAR